MKIVHFVAVILPVILTIIERLGEVQLLSAQNLNNTTEHLSE